MPLVNSSELEVKALTVVIYGKPDIGKTTLAFTAKRPLIIDFDQLSYKANISGDVWTVNNWQEALDLLKAPELDMFDTIVIDTISTSQEFLTKHLIEESPKLGTRVGLTRDGWARLKNDQVDFFKRLNMMGKNVIVNAHEDRITEGDFNKYQPKVKGGTLNFLVETVPLIGHYYAEGKKRILDFTLDENHVTKGEKLGRIENPTDFQHILDSYFNKVRYEQQQQTGILNMIRNYREKIKAVASAEEVNTLVGEMKDFAPSVKLQLTPVFTSKLEELKLEKDPESGLFVSPAPAKTTRTKVAA